MSGSSGTGTIGKDDKGKSVDSKEELKAIQEEEQEIRPSIDCASLEGNAVSSNPTESDSDTEEHPKSGESSSNPPKVHEFKFKKFLFDIQLTHSDVIRGMLSIPVEIALDHFPEFTPRLVRVYCEKIKIFSLTQPRHRSMVITYDTEESTFVINSRKWQQFCSRHNFKANDILRFFQPYPRAENTRFLIEHIIKGDDDAITSPVVPEFKQENFLFEKRLILYELRNMSERPLSLPKEEVNKHFSVLRIPALHKMERLYFTDDMNKEWCWKIMFLSGTYMVVDGWEGFVNQHKVDAGDVIRFYKLEENRGFLHPERHFCIQHVRKIDVPALASETSTSMIGGQSGTSARKNDAGTSTNRSGGDRSADRGADIRNTRRIGGNRGGSDRGGGGRNARIGGNRGGGDRGGVGRNARIGGNRGGRDRGGGSQRGGRSGGRRKQSSAGHCCMS